MIYIDNQDYPYGRMIMNHLFADTLSELHNVAMIIGVNRKWFQTKNKKFPHYDICLSKKKLAIEYGVKEVSVRETVEISKTIELIKELSK